MFLHSSHMQYDHRRPETKDVDGENSQVEDPVNRVDDRALLNWKHDSEGVKHKSPNLEGFNETLYISSAHKDQDSYKLNAFNQEESDKLRSDRAVPDSRNHK